MHEGACGPRAPSILHPVGNIKGHMMRNGYVKRFFVALPAILGSIISCMGCPMCLPLYATLLSSLGLDPAVSGPFIMVIIVISMVTTLALLYRNTKRHGRSWVPFSLALTSGVLSLGCKINGFTHVSYILLGIFFLSVMWPKHLHPHKGHDH